MVQIYCKRDAQNRIVGFSQHPDPDFPEAIADDDPAIISFEQHGVQPTQAELDTEDTNEVSNALQNLGGLDRAELKGLFEHENRIRALEGKQSITLQQFATWVKGNLRG